MEEGEGAEKRTISGDFQPAKHGEKELHPPKAFQTALCGESIEEILLDVDSRGVGSPLPRGLNKGKLLRGQRANDPSSLLLGGLFYLAHVGQSGQNVFDQPFAFFFVG